MDDFDSGFGSDFGMGGSGEFDRSDPSDLDKDISGSDLPGGNTGWVAETASFANWALHSTNLSSIEFLTKFGRRDEGMQPLYIGQVGVGDFLAQPNGLDQVEVGNNTIFSHTYPDKFIFYKQWEELIETEAFPCYGLILALPDNKDMISYLINHKHQLDQISGSNCLILGVVKERYWPDRDVNKRLTHDGIVMIDLPYNDQFSRFSWDDVVNEMVKGGQSLKIGEYYRLKRNEFPALILFRHIRDHSGEIVITKFGKAKVEAIARTMDTIFTGISEAVKEGKDPLSGVKRDVLRERLNLASGGVWEGAGEVTIKVVAATIAKLIENLLKRGAD